MDERDPDFSADAPAPPAAWKVRLVYLATRLPPYRFAWFRRRFLRLYRARRRAARRRLEAAGDTDVLRPSLYRMADRLDAYLDKDGGFFVEAGANDGYEQSNTYHLEKQRRWRGLLVEPVPELHREAVIERPGSRVVNCALMPFDHDGSDVQIQYGGLMSVVSGTHGSDEADREYVAPAFVLGMEEPHTVRVPARTLSSLLDEMGAPEVDFMSLDVEGFEASVLRGLDLERHAPRFLLVEIRDMATGLAPIQEVLGDRYVAVEQISPFDLLFARADQPEASTRSYAAASRSAAARVE